jgi:hypothetical protein
MISQRQGDENNNQWGWSKGLFVSRSGVSLNSAVLQKIVMQFLS